MTRQNVFIVIAIAIVCLVAGYWLALPAKQVVAPVVGVPMNVISIRDTSSSQIYAVTGEYPQFGNVTPDFNVAIASYVDANLSQFKTSAVQNWQARLATMPTGTVNTLPAQSFTFDTSWTPDQINSRYISIIVRLEYFDGGANETQLLQTFNYDVAAKKMMTLANLFPNVPGYLSKIATIAIQQLTSSENNNSNGNAVTDMIQQGAAPMATNYSNFTFNDDVVNIYFPKYQVAPGSFGEQEVGIVRSTIN